MTSSATSGPLEIELEVGGKGVFTLRLCNNRSTDRRNVVIIFESLFRALFILFIACYRRFYLLDLENGVEL